MVMKTDRVFCPKCGCKDLEEMGADSPEWIGDMEIGTCENYICKECGHDFSISASYEMTCYNYLNEDNDEDVLIEE